MPISPQELAHKAHEAREARKAAGLSAIPTPEEQFSNNPTRWGLAIKVKCRDCMGLQDPHIQWRIGNCPIQACALHGFRPYQEYEGRETPASLL